MKQKTLLWIAVIFLLLLNLGNLSIDMYQQSKRPQKKSPKEIIIQRLHFDAGQTAAYEDLIQAHQKDLDLLEMQRKKLKEELYEKLSHGNPDGNSKIMVLSKIQLALEQVHFQHYLSLKQLCRPDQLPAFDSLALDLDEILAPPKHKAEHYPQGLAQE